MASDTEDECTIEAVLNGMGLGQYVSGFTENMIQIEDVESMSDSDFQKVGIDAIGLRIRIQNACKNSLKAKNDVSPVVKQFYQLQKDRKKAKSKKSERSNYSDKGTRRFYCGWKHALKPNQFRLVSASKGGGQQYLDMKRDETRQDIEREILNLYFPNGRSIAQNLNTEDLNYYVASFSGASLPDFKEEGGFTVDKYFKSVNTYPVRIYLHTTVRNLNESISPSSQTSETSTSCTSAETIETCEIQCPAVISQTSTSGTGAEAMETCEIPSAIPQVVESDSDFEDAGTPTITFRRPRPRRLLTLRRPNAPSNSSTPLPNNTSLTATPQISTSNITPTTSADPIRVSDNEEMDVPVIVPETESDEDIQRAINASLGIETSEPTKECLLKTWISCTFVPVESEKEQEVIVHRRHTLDSAIRAVSRPNFKFEEPFKVLFSGELASDFGGPKREFLSILMKDVATAILEGDVHHMNFIHSVAKLDKKLFHTAGKLVAWSLLHGGPGLPLNPAVYRLMVQQQDTTLTLEDVVDTDIKEKIEKVNTAPDDELLNMMEWLFEQGIILSTAPFTPDKREEVTNNILKSHVYLRIHAEMTQFTDGLNCVGGFFDVIKEHPTTLSSLFALNEETLTARLLRSLLQINYSAEGSNNKRYEEDTIYAFDLFMQDISEESAEINLKDLLSFWTGADAIPPLGFHKKLEINFIVDKTRLPVAHTCEMSLDLARGEDPEGLKEKLTKAIQWGGEFHLV